MQKLIIVAIILLISLPVSAGTKTNVEEKKPHVTKQRKTSSVPVKLVTEEQKSLYGVGLVIARQLKVFNLSPVELRIVKQGINDGIRGRKPKVDFAIYSKKSQELGIARRDAHGKKLEAVAQEFIEEAANEEGAVKTKSRLVYHSLEEGEGKSPAETDKVRLNYICTLVDGWEVDSTYKRGEPDETELNNYFKCVTEAVQMMKPGGKARLVCPPELGEGKAGSGVIPPNATLVFEVELLAVRKP